MKIIKTQDDFWKYNKDGFISLGLIYDDPPFHWKKDYNTRIKNWKSHNLDEIIKKIKRATGSKTIEQFGFCGRDGFGLNKSEAYLIQPIFNHLLKEGKRIYHNCNYFTINKDNCYPYNWENRETFLLKMITINYKNIFDGGGGLFQYASNIIHFGIPTRYKSKKLQEIFTKKYAYELDSDEDCKELVKFYDDLMKSKVSDIKTEKLFIEDKCMFCLDDNPSTVVFPCRHKVVCSDCSQKLEKSHFKKVCIKCKQPISKIIYNNGRVINYKKF